MQTLYVVEEELGNVHSESREVVGERGLEARQRAEMTCCSCCDEFVELAGIPPDAVEPLLQTSDELYKKKI